MKNNKEGWEDYLGFEVEEDIVFPLENQTCMV